MILWFDWKPEFSLPYGLQCIIHGPHSLVIPHSGFILRGREFLQIFCDPESFLSQPDVCVYLCAIGGMVQSTNREIVLFRQVQAAFENVPREIIPLQSTGAIPTRSVTMLCVEVINAREAASRCACGPLTTDTGSTGIAIFHCIINLMYTFLV